MCEFVGLVVESEHDVEEQGVEGGFSIVVLCELVEFSSASDRSSSSSSSAL